MFKNKLTTFASLIGAVALASAAHAHEFDLGDIHIDHPFARASMPKQSAGAAYFDLQNHGKTDDKLVKIGVDAGIAKSAEIHSMEVKNNVMKMRDVGHVDLKAGSKVSMKPGAGLHIMLMGLQQPLKAGETFPLTLEFEKAGKIDVMVNVESNDATTVDHPQQHQH